MGYRIHTSDVELVRPAYVEDMGTYFDDDEMGEVDAGLVLDDGPNMEAFVVTGRRDEVRALGYSIVVAATPSIDANAANALAAYEELMRESEAAEYMDTGDALGVMADLAAALERITSPSDPEDDSPAPRPRYSVLRNGGPYAEFGTPEQAEEYRAARSAEQPDHDWTVAPRRTSAE
jgi:hypothetical protein